MGIEHADEINIILPVARMAIPLPKRSDNSEKTVSSNFFMFWTIISTALISAAAVA